MRATTKGNECVFLFSTQLPSGGGSDVINSTIAGNHYLTNIKNKHDSFAASQNLTLKFDDILFDTPPLFFLFF